MVDYQVASVQEIIISGIIFITDIITEEEASVEFCTTLDMIMGYFTNALQGYQSCRFVNIIIFIHEDEINSYNFSRR